MKLRFVDGVERGRAERRAWIVALGFFLTVCASACGDDTTEPDRDVQLSIDNADTLTFGAVGSNAQLTASVTVSEGSTPSITWRSTARDVATVSPTGLVASAGNGTAMIIATAEQASDTVTAVVQQLPVLLRFDDQPTHTAVNIPFLFPVIVTIADSNGVAVQGGGESVALQLGMNPSGASLTGRTTTSSIDGTAEFDSVVLDAAGSGFTLEASTTELSTTSIPFDVVSGPDIVRLTNTGNEPVGVVIDGQSTSFVNDYRIVTSDSTVPTVMSNASRGDEIVAFVEGRPPEILTDSLWSDDIDTVNVTYRDPISISVTAWIVAGPFDDSRARAVTQAATTSAVWAAERMGLDFEEFEIIDATTDPDADALQSTTQCDQRSLARSTIGVRTDRINVYYVGVVDNGRDRGYSCGDVIFMADRSGHELLVHEIGHSLSLGHIDHLPGYDRTNVMHSASNDREFLTEGQVFRQHFNMASALSALYGIEPNGLRRCADPITTDRCMELILRLWADGTFPPNR